MTAAEKDAYAREQRRLRRSGAAPASTAAAPPVTAKSLATDAGSMAQAQVNNPTIQAGQNYIQNSLGATNFNGINDYLANAGNKAGQSSFEEPLALLRDFLGGGSGGAQPARGGAGGGEVRRGYSPGSRAYQAGLAPGLNGQTVNGGSGSGGIKDTISGPGFMNEQIRALFDPSRLDPANDPTMKPYLDAFHKEALEQYQRSVADLDARAEGSGRYGGGLYQQTRALANEEFNEATQAQLSQVLFGSRQSALDRQMQGIGLGNQRDIASMGDHTQRYGIDAQERASNAASSAAAGANADALAAQRRGQDLQAINALMGHQQFGLGMEADVGKLMQGQQLGSLSQIPGLDGANQGYLQVMNQSSGVLQQPELARIANQPANASLAWQKNVYNSPESQLNRYLQMIGGIAGLGGATWGQGEAPPMLPMGPSPLAAGAMGGLGGWMYGQGQGGS